MTIQQYFKTTLTKTYSKKEDEIEVLGNAEVDKSKLEPGKLYLQVAMVTPYIDPSEEDTRNTAFSKNFNLSNFLFFFLLMTFFTYVLIREFLIRVCFFGRKSTK